MADLRLLSFGPDGGPLGDLESRQSHYLQHYLADLGAQSVLVEPDYFDRDWLAEFAAFYSVSAKSYSNRCQRLHFFSAPLTRELVERFAQGEAAARAEFQRAYLGFTVLRPLPAAPLGRTVLQWYPDQAPKTPRVIEPARIYRCHLLGHELEVRGLAWQQQDAGVGRCATIAVWSMLHSSAFSDHHAIPTTTRVTRAAHQTAALGSRVFPSSGLTINQLLESIKECGLAPMIVPGDTTHQGESAFTRGHFAASCASLIRSGYPAVLLGRLGAQGRHATCLVGFRECVPPAPGDDQVELQDAGIEHLYVHDDNIGPSVRIAIQGVARIAGASALMDGPREVVSLVPSTPPRTHRLKLRVPDPTDNYPAFYPSQIVAAVHEELRLSADGLHSSGLKVAGDMRRVIAYLKNEGLLSGDPVGLTLSTRFRKVYRYLDADLGQVLSSRPAVLGDCRLRLVEAVDPMSLHVGVVRIGYGSTPLVDVLYDTTGSDHNVQAFCYVCFDQRTSGVIELMIANGFLASVPVILAGV